MSVIEWLFGRAVYHRVVRKNRRDALQPCTGIAFRTRRRYGVPLTEIPATCQSCGQAIQTRHLDWSRTVMEPLPVPSIAATREIVIRAAERPPRHHGAKGGLVTEVPDAR